MCADKCSLALKAWTPHLLPFPIFCMYQDIRVGWWRFLLPLQKKGGDKKVEKRKEKTRGKGAAKFATKFVVSTTF